MGAFSELDFDIAEPKGVAAEDMRYPSSSAELLRAIKDALVSVSRPDYLAIVTPNGEAYYFAVARVRRAIEATSPRRMKARISFTTERGLEFAWGVAGRLRLAVNPGRYVVGRRTVEEWKPFTGAARPAILHLTNV